MVIYFRCAWWKWGPSLRSSQDTHVAPLEPVTCVGQAISSGGGVPPGGREQLCLLGARSYDYQQGSRPDHTWRTWPNILRQSLLNTLLSQRMILASLQSIMTAWPQEYMRLESRKLPPAKQLVLKHQLDALLKLVGIKPSRIWWPSPVVLVRKTLDFCRVKDLNSKYSYPPHPPPPPHPTPPPPPHPRVVQNGSQTLHLIWEVVIGRYHCTGKISRK